METQEEIWRDVAGYEGIYQVSSQGRVRSLDRVSCGRRLRGVLMVGSSDHAGYRQVHLAKGGRGNSATRKVHFLVCEAFHGPRPPGQVTRHLDGDKLNNRASNLAWGTPSENSLDSVRHGTHPQASRTKCPDGHPYDEANAYVGRDGRRRCRTCISTRSQARYLRLVEQECYLPESEAMAAVREFHEVFGLPINDTTQTPGKLRADLIREEAAETAEAIEIGNLEDKAKELADLAYVVYGAALTFGIDLDEAIAEVHRSNMSKLVDGRPVMRADGKVLKGPNYRPPDMARAVVRALREET